MKPRELATGIALALGSLLLVAGILELALRYVVLPPLNPFAPDPEVGFRLKADFEGVYPRTPVRTDGRRHRIPLDAPGLRSGEILFVGDSVTFGYGIDARDTYVERLGRRIGRPLDVTNAAVPAYNLYQVLEILERNLEWQRPELVVYGAVYNDLLAAHLESFEEAYQGINPHAGPPGSLAGTSLLYALIERRTQRLLAEWTGPDPGETAEGDEGGGLLDRVDPEVIGHYRRQWRRLEEIQRRTGVPLYVLVLPYRDQLTAPGSPRDWQDFLVELCGDGPLHCLDPLEALLPYSAQALFSGRAKTHFTPRGHELLADWLIRRLPLATGGSVGPSSGPR